MYAKNRMEWAVTDIACLRSDITIVPFFDSLGKEALAFVINQCELRTMCVEKTNFDLLLSLKETQRCESL